MFRIQFLTCMVFLIISISGCWQTVNFNDIDTATKICAKSNSTVVSISANFAGGESVFCSDRTDHNLQEK